MKNVLAIASPLLAALALKTALLVSGSVPFNSDEAVVALMAKHILHGEWPVFFWGEAYVGSLDAVLCAVAFKLLGVSVASARVVQTILFGSTILTTYLLAQRVTGSRFAATACAWLLAIPPVLLSLYTTVGIGAYGETLLFGSLLLLIGHKLLNESEDSPALWLAFGGLAGLAFWTFGLIVVYLLPVCLLMLPRRKRQQWGHYALAFLAFLVGSSPWWWYNFTHGNAALRVLYDPAATRPGVPLVIRAFGLISLGLPALFGMRDPWAPGLTSPVLAPLALAFYLAVLVYAAVAWRHRHPGVEGNGRSLLWLLCGVFVALFLGTRFGLDATGRYLLPLYAPLFIFAGDGLAALRTHSRPMAIALLALILGLNLWNTVAAMRRIPPGVTTQLHPALQFDNRYDEELITFLKEHGGRYGYSHHWITWKIAFLSDEQVILIARLPYQPDLRYSPRDDRYPSYSQRVAASDHVVYVTSQESNLDSRLRANFAELGVTHRERDIGPYRVFYDLSARVEPWQVQNYSYQPVPSPRNQKGP